MPNTSKAWKRSPISPCTRYASRHIFLFFFLVDTAFITRGNKVDNWVMFLPHWKQLNIVIDNLMLCYFQYDIFVYVCSVCFFDVVLVLIIQIKLPLWFVFIMQQACNEIENMWGIIILGDNINSIINRGGRGQVVRFSISFSMWWEFNAHLDPWFFSIQVK